MSAPEHPALALAAGWGLTTPARPVALPTEELPQVAPVVLRDRLGGLMAHALMDGWVQANAWSTGILRDIWDQQLLASVMVEAQVVRAADVLDRAGVTWRLSKGAALAHLDYPDPALRPFGDADIVVSAEHWEAMLAAFAAETWTRAAPELHPGYDRRFGKGATFSTPEGLQVDAHLRFAIGRFAVGSDLAAVLGTPDWIMLAGRQVPTLDPVGRLLHACHHAALGGFQHLRAHRDIAQLLLVTGADWAAAADAARDWGAEAVVATAIDQTWRRLALPMDHPAADWAREVRISRRDRRALEVFEADRPFREQSLTSLGALPLREMPAYVSSVFTPDALRRHVMSWRSRR